MEEILVDKEGYKQFLEELEILKEKNLSLSSVASEAYKDAVGDGWHDNFTFEDTMRESRKIVSQIDKMIGEQHILRIIDNGEYDKDLVNIGDVLRIEFVYNEDDNEEEVIKLTGKYIPNTNSDIKEISLNSPLGKTIFKNRIGNMLEYTVNNIVLKVKIIKKM